MKYPNDWFDFASENIEDGKILLRELRYNITCFVSQQAAEKALKGFLVHNEQLPTRGHNLNNLIELCSLIDDSFNNLSLNAAILDQFYLPTRYPDAPVGSLPSGIPNKATAEKALMYAKEIFDFCIDAIERIDKKRIERRDR